MHERYLHNFLMRALRIICKRARNRNTGAGVRRRQPPVRQRDHPRDVRGAFSVRVESRVAPSLERLPLDGVELQVRGNIIGHACAQQICR